MFPQGSAPPKRLKTTVVGGGEVEERKMLKLCKVFQLFWQAL